MFLNPISVLTVLKKETDVQGRNVVWGVVCSRGWNSCITSHYWRGENLHCKHILGTLVTSKSGRDELKTHGSSLQIPCASVGGRGHSPSAAPPAFACFSHHHFWACFRSDQSPWSTFAEQGCWATNWFSQNWLLHTRSLMPYSETMLNACCECVGRLRSDSLFTPENIFIVTHYSHLLLSY